MTAEEVAREWMAGHIDACGDPAIDHIERVAKRVESTISIPAWLLPYATKVAWLHDVVEDTDKDFWHIRELFGKVVAEAVEAITRGDESYFHYIARVKAHPIARAVKIADLLDHLGGTPPHLSEDLTDLPGAPHPPPGGLLKRYVKALDILLD